MRRRVPHRLPDLPPAIGPRLAPGGLRAHGAAPGGLSRHQAARCPPGGVYAGPPLERADCHRAHYDQSQRSRPCGGGLSDHPPSSATSPRGGRTRPSQRRSRPPTSWAGGRARRSSESPPPHGRDRWSDRSPPGGSPRTPTAAPRIRRRSGTPRTAGWRESPPGATPCARSPPGASRGPMAGGRSGSRWGSPPPHGRDRWSDRSPPGGVHALRRQPRVYAAGVACRARLGGVNAHKRVRGVREGRVTPAPIAGTMALGAVGGEARRSVIGTLGALVVGQVTADAIGGRPLIDTVGMAARALERGVDSHEMKRRVIEPGLPPRGVAGEVAHGAVGGEARRHVIRVPGPAVVLSVAGVAVRADRQVEAAGRMAADASHGGVLGADGEPGVRLVVPGHGGPRDRPVAVLALVPQPGPDGSS